jgi:hypothetical protein
MAGRPKSMDTRKIVSLPAHLAQAIEDYRFERRLKTEAEAIRQLIEAGLKAPRSGTLGGSQSGGDSNPGADAKPATQRKPLPKRSIARARPLSKKAQLRALREATP